MSRQRHHSAGRLAAMHSGDGASARLLWEEQAGRLTALARAVTGSHADALDAVQEAFVSVLSLSAADARAVEDEAAYLARAVHGRALNLLRSSSRRAAHEREGGKGEGGYPRLAAEGDPALERAMDSLALNTREVLALRHIAGLSFEQIAYVLETPKSTVSSRYYAALEQLRGVLESPRPPSPPSAKEVARA